MSTSRFFTQSLLSSAFAVSCSLFALTAPAFADGGAPRGGSIKDAPLAPAPFTWTGFYAGVHAGVAWAEADNSRSGINNAYIVNAPNWDAMIAGKPSASDAGFIGGAQLGYNVQAGTMVYGIEADFSWLKGNAAASRVYDASAPVNPFFTTDRAEMDWLITIRPRIGLTAGKSMFYVTGGLALSEIKTSHTFSDSIAPVFFENTSASDVKSGWTIGGGLEMALGGNWTLKGEYLYVDFGSVRASGTLIDSATGLSASAPPTIHNHNVDVSLHTARLGLNYKF